jgi:anti-sigma factor RsiW
MTPSVPEIPDVHPTVLRLPEYLSGQLSDAERSEVERHIQSCPACKEELGSMAGLRAELKDAVDRAPGPSARVRAEVFRRLDERLAPRIGLADRFAQAFRWVLQPKWAPALAVLIIAGQLGALAWLTVRPGGQPDVQVRGLPTASTRLSIVFNPSASQRDVAEALRALGAHIVNGPTAEGAYIIEIAPAAPTELANRLRALRERRELVERLDTAPP